MIAEIRRLRHMNPGVLVVRWELDRCMARVMYFHRNAPLFTTFESRHYICWAVDQSLRNDWAVLELFD